MYRYTFMYVGIAWNCTSRGVGAPSKACSAPRSDAEAGSAQCDSQNFLFWAIIYTYLYVVICICAYMYACMYVCMYVRTCVRTYVCTYICP